MLAVGDNELNMQDDVSLEVAEAEDEKCKKVQGSHMDKCGVNQQASSKYPGTAGEAWVN